MLGTSVGRLSCFCSFHSGLFLLNSVLTCSISPSLPLLLVTTGKRLPSARALKSDPKYYPFFGSILVYEGVPYMIPCNFNRQPNMNHIMQMPVRLLMFPGKKEHSLVALVSRYVWCVITESAFVDPNYVCKISDIWLDDILPFTAVVLIILKPWRRVFFIIFILVIVFEIWFCGFVIPERY